MVEDVAKVEAAADAQHDAEEAAKIGAAEAGSPKGADPYDFFRSTAHGIRQQHIAHQLIEPGKSVLDCMAKAHLGPDLEVPIMHFYGKCNDNGLTEGAKMPFSVPLDRLKVFLVLTTATHGYARAQFAQTASGLYSPDSYAMRLTGKPLSGGTDKRFGILKRRQRKEEGESE